MSWIKIDDSIGGHPKSLAISDSQYLAAIGLHILAIAYCNAHRTDGVLPKRAIKLLAPKRPRYPIQELIKVGYWHDIGESYEIHDYLDWQQSAGQIVVASEKGKRGADARWGKVGNASGNASGNAEENRREEKKKRDKDICPKKPISDTPEFERFWKVYPNKTGKGAARKSFAKAMKMTDLDSLLAGVDRYSKSQTVKDGFVCLPATWLNQERWSDEAIPFLLDDDDFRGWGEHM